MNITKTDIVDLLIIEPKVFKDPRGYFFESYNKENLQDQNINLNFIQDNQSKSTYGVIRGLHYQLDPFAQTKLVRVLQGEIFDVALDLRKNSPTFGKWFGINISEENHKQLLIPKGFAHGFSVLSKEAVVLYKCDNSYNPKSEEGIIYNDKQLNIDWQISADKAIVSDNDKILPDLKNANYNFNYFK